MTDESPVDEAPIPEPPADETATEAPAPPAATTAPQAAGGPPRRRSKAFTRQLLARLPQLVVPKWEAGESRQVHQDMQSVVDLDADAFLEPLERLAGGTP